jgi:phage shock protein A
MATEIEKAFETLAGAFTATETEIHEEIASLEQHIQELQERIVELHGKQETLAHDRQAIAEIYSRHSGSENAVEF